MYEQLDKRDPAIRAEIAARFNGGIPYNQAIGLRVVDVAGERIVTALDYRECFLGDPGAGLWHTSVGLAAADEDRRADGAVTGAARAPRGDLVWSNFRAKASSRSGV